MQAQALKKAQALLSAANKYQQQTNHTIDRHAPVIWQHGNARLLDFGRSIKGRPEAYALIVPSLINRYYILDLSKRRSFVNYLTSQNIYPIVLDWDEPGTVEENFDMADYVQQILLPACEFFQRSSGEPIHLVGYCLGGVLSLAAAQLRPELIASLSLLATPWDFLSDDMGTMRLNETQLGWIKNNMLSESMFPAAALQWLFMARQPYAFEQKFLKFNEMTNPADIEDFVHVEHWVGDSVDMTSPAAVDCLIHWAQENQLFDGKWHVDGQVIQPEQITQPCFISIPSQDQIVPTGCADALAKLLPHATTSYPNTGHVGMMVGRNAKRDLWEPCSSFILSS